MSDVLGWLHLVCHDQTALSSTCLGNKEAAMQVAGGTEGPIEERGDVQADC